MSHLFPLALAGRDALVGAEHAARSKADAERLCTLADRHVGGLETEWLTLTPAELAEVETEAEAGVSAGFVQRYENADGAAVLAITYWRIVPTGNPSELAQELPPEPARQDHTDDLYFRQGRTKKRRRKKVDPNQMDLFGKPDA